LKKEFSTGIKKKGKKIEEFLGRKAEDYYGLLDAF